MPNSTQKPEAVIRMLTYEPVILTTEEYEQLQKEAVANAFADPGTVSNRIVAKLLAEHHSRYLTAKEQNAVR